MTGRLTTVVGSTAWTGRRGPPRRSLADPWDRVASRSGPSGPLRATSRRPGRGTVVRVLRPAAASVPVTPEEEYVARRGQRQSGARRTAPRNQRRVRDRDNEGIIPVLARAVREVETARPARPVTPSARTKFQVVALLVREERARVKADTRAHRGPARRAAQAARRHRHDPGQDRRPRHLAARAARRGRRGLRRGPALKREMLTAAGVEAAPEEARRPSPTRRLLRRHRAPGGAAVGRLPPAGQPVPRPRLLRRRRPRVRAAPARQLGAARPAVPLLRVRRGGAPACMPLPEPRHAARPRRPAS